MQQQPILVVDDDDVISGAVALALADEGYAVMAAANGKEALARTKHQPPCLILLDMKMPEMDGWAFAAAYREQPGPHAPIVAMTAACDSQTWANEITADGCVVKPFDLDDFLDLVHHLAPQGQP
jgi:CheY-like chemotaxis protein